MKRALKKLVLIVLLVGAARGGVALQFALLANGGGEVARKICYWTFDERPGATNLLDSAGSANGLVGSGVEFVASTAGDGLAMAGDFSGTDEPILLSGADELDLGTSDFTVTGWFKSPLVTGEDYYHLILFNGSPDNGGINLWLGRDGNSNRGRLGFNVMGAANIAVKSDARWDDDTWYWFAASVSNRMARLYVDGVLQDSAAYGEGTTATAPSTMNATLGYGWSGQLDDIRIYDSAVEGEFSEGVLTGGKLYEIWKNTAFCNAPIVWEQPVGFDSSRNDLGLTVLTAATHTVIYNPAMSHACLDEGGDGVFESVNHGLFNHDANIMLCNDEEKIVVYWGNHAWDENAPGGRVLARAGAFENDGAAINWAENVVELVPQPVALRRRTFVNSSTNICETYGRAKLYRVGDERIYLRGYVGARHGWCNVDGNAESFPVSSENYSDARTDTFKYGRGFDVGPWFWQRWFVTGTNDFSNTTVMYKDREPLTSFQLAQNPTLTKPIEQASGAFTNTLPFSSAAPTFENDVLNRSKTTYYTTPYYASGTKSWSADGVDGLAHYSEYQRPDGKWVVIRDTIENPGKYYAALKDDIRDYYPPAYETALYGYAMPRAGTLPDGRCFIVGNSQDRCEMYITVSSDGIVFDKTWLVLHLAFDDAHDGIGKVIPSGPMYFKSVIKGDFLWITYSIGKEQIGITRVPLSALD